MFSSRKNLYQIAVVFVAITFVLSGSATASRKDKAKKKADQTQQQTSSTKVDLNSASEKDLNSLPGVGPATVKKIVAGRPYSSVDDLKKAGVSDSQIEKIRGLVTASSANLAPASTGSNEAATSTKQSSVTPAQSASSLPESDNSTAAPPPNSGMVWANTQTKIYHREGDRWYGKTKHGKYMTEADAQKAGYRAAKTGKDKE
jgi:hypothetical protein